MAHHRSEHSSEGERRSRKKSSHTSSKSSKSRSRTRRPQHFPSVPTPSPSSYAPPVQAASTHYLSVQQPFPQNTQRTPQGAMPFATAPVQHPIYGQIPQNLSQYMRPYAQISPPATSHSTVRFNASPPSQNQREEGPFKEQWDRLDRMAAKSYTNLRDGASKSVTKLTTNYIERPTHAVAMKSMQTLCKGAALCDVISSKFDAVMTSIDNERFSGKEQDLMIYSPPQPPSPSSSPPPAEGPKGTPPDDLYPMLKAEKGSNHFSKVWLYSNSRLPPHLPPFKVYMPTYPLLCLAATYSERVYTPPGSKGSEAETHIPSDWRSGTKAMVLKSVPVEDLNTIVFAIRGSQTFMDWAVNYNSAPDSPEDFLDDASNLCHAGFLYVAKRMVKPVADRLRILLQENPARSNCSLLITGHSAGGAVASLLYAHMMSTAVESELSYLTSFFKRVHCVTFGAPPVSIRPLKKSEDRRHRKSLFYAFINEGDPVPRADKGVVRSLLKLYASPAPTAVSLAGTITSMSKLNLAQPVPSSPPKSKLKSSFGLASRLAKPSKSSLQTTTTTTSASTTSTLPAWPVPSCSLSPAGRLVILRQKPGSSCEESIEAVTVEEDMLKKVVYGDPLKHQMRVYRKRVEGIATRAVTASGF